MRNIANFGAANSARPSATSSSRKQFERDLASLRSYRKMKAAQRRLPTLHPGRTDLAA